MPQFSYFFFFEDFFLFLVLFVILSHYDITDSSHCLREYVQMTIDKVFREELMVKVFSKISRTFLMEFCFLLFLWLFS